MTFGAIEAGQRVGCVTVGALHVDQVRVGRCSVGLSPGRFGHWLAADDRFNRLGIGTGLRGQGRQRTTEDFTHLGPKLGGLETLRPREGEFDGTADRPFLDLHPNRAVVTVGRGAGSNRHPCSPVPPLPEAVEQPVLDLSKHRLARPPALELG